MLFGDGVVNARGIGYDYINVRGRFALIYQSLHWSLRYQETDKLRNKNNEVLVIDVLTLQDIVFENILSTEQLTFQLLTLISFN